MNELDKKVIEIITLQDGFTLADCFTPDFITNLVEIPAGTTVEIGSSRNDDGTYSPPLPPTPDPTLIEQKRIADIKKQLDDIDTKSVRSLRSIFALIATGKTPDPADVTYISNLKAQADALRATL